MASLRVLVKSDRGPRSELNVDEHYIFIISTSNKNGLFWAQTLSITISGYPGRVRRTQFSAMT
jgi:hypothetical protein